MNCGESTWEYTSRHPSEEVPGQLVPETMYAFNPSGENAAAVAFGIRIGTKVRTLLLQLLQMLTLLGESVVSDKITVLESGETASTRPAAPLNGETEPPLKIISPCVPKPALSTPRYAKLALAGPNRSELGAKGRFTGVPAVKVEVVPLRVMGTILVVQACVVLPHAVVVTYVVGLVVGGVPVTSKLKGIAG